MMRVEEMNENRQGFTLIELLLVIAILGILGTVAVVNLAGTTDKARIETTRQTIAAVATAIQLYETNTTKGLPSSLDELTKPLGEYPAPLKKDKLNDAWGNKLQYKKQGKYEYEVRSAGPDGNMGSGDDITN
jgi:general secretion pathway protein G